MLSILLPVTSFQHTNTHTLTSALAMRLHIGIGSSILSLILSAVGAWLWLVAGLSWQRTWATLRVDMIVATLCVWGTLAVFQQSMHPLVTIINLFHAESAFSISLLLKKSDILNFCLAVLTSISVSTCSQDQFHYVLQPSSTFCTVSASLSSNSLILQMKSCIF